MDIAGWLANLGLGRYASTFAANEITPDALTYLSEADLKELGLPIGPRRIVLAAIAELARPQAGPGHGDSAAVAHQEAERRQLTLMFVDLVGSTAMSGELDPEDMAGVILAYQTLVVGEIARVDGHVAKFMGDGVLGYFGWPRAHENEAERAVRAALAIARQVPELKTAALKRLEVRIGVATGLVMVGDLVWQGSAAQEQAVVGEAPNLAARLQALAEPGTVVVADSTRRLVGDLFELVDLGFQPLKGFANPVQVWKVTGESNAEARFGALHGRAPEALVGRDRELGVLLDRWRRAREGFGQVVLVSGEAGIGKSRLALAVSEQLRDQEYGWIRLYGSPYHCNSALYPALDQLRRAAGLAQTDSAQAKHARLRQYLAAISPDLAEEAPLVAEHLALGLDEARPALVASPEQKKARMFRILLAQLESLASAAPLLITVEDAHWLDPTSLELLDRFVDRLERLPALLVVTYRPDFIPRWTERAHVGVLALGRLEPGASAALIGAVTGHRPLPAAVQAEILAKSEGVPLFVEELTKSVLDSGLLRQLGNRYEFEGSLPKLAIPSTLQDTLLARLDRSPRAKEIAQIGAVIGREFSSEVLRAVAEVDDASVAAGLNELVSCELAFSREKGPVTIYSFKHALIRDAAYESLLKSRRRQLHRRVATVICEGFPVWAKAEPELLAHHATEGGLTDLALTSWLEAGLQANHRSAHAEAIAHLSRGFDLLPHCPDSAARDRSELRLQLALGVPLALARGRTSSAVMETYSRARELADRLGDQSQLFPALRGLWTGFRARGEIAKARKLSDELLAIAQRLEQPSLLLEAYHARWTTRFGLGEWQAVREQTAAGLALYRPEYFENAFLYGGHDSAVCALAKQGIALWMLGLPDQALGCAEEAVARARALRHPPSLMHALTHALLVHYLRGDHRSHREKAEEVARIAGEGMARWVPFSILQTLYVQAIGGETDLAERMPMARDALAAELAGDVEKVGFCVSLFGEVCRLAGELDEGLSAARAAISEVVRTGVLVWEPELRRVAGEFLRSLSPPKIEESAASYREALRTAREQGALSLQLRAAMSLATLPAGDGQKSEAVELLAAVYARFTEGLDTPDLMAAKHILDLSGHELSCRLGAHCQVSRP